MKITSVEAFTVRVPFDDGRPNLTAGQAFAAPGVHPALPAGHPGVLTTEYPPVWRTKAVYTDTIEAVIDRLVIKAGIEKRLADSIATAMNLADGIVTMLMLTGDLVPPA